MLLREYAPQIYQTNLDMQYLLKSEEDEFENNLKPSIENSFKDTFILTATENGVARYEKIFSILPDTTTESLEFRKERVLNRLISQIPFTERYLQQKLNYIIGENTNSDFTPSNTNNTQWYYDIDYGNYQLDIYIAVPGRSWLNELRDTLQKIIPCNIYYTINVYVATWQQVYEHFPTWQDIYDAELTWEDVMNAEWLL